MTVMTLEDVVAVSRKCHFYVYNNAEQINDYKGDELVVWQLSDTVIG